MSAKACKKLLCNGLVAADFRTIAQADAKGELSQDQQRKLRNLQGLWCNSVAEVCPEAGRVCMGPIAIAEWCTTKAIRDELTDDQLDALAKIDETTMELISETLFPPSVSQ